MRVRAPILVLAVLLAAGEARPYGYGTDDDPLLLAFGEAVRAARRGDVAAARAQLDRVRWQTDELKDDVRVDAEPALRAAHRDGASEAEVVEAWANLVYLALIQKFHWNLSEGLADYAKARARLTAARTYYEVALAGNVRKDDLARRGRDPAAPSRHDDILRRFDAAREALGSPSLLGAGGRPPVVEAFRSATTGIVGHLNAVFPRFLRPGQERR